MIWGDMNKGLPTNDYVEFDIKVAIPKSIIFAHFNGI